MRWRDIKTEKFRKLDIRLQKARDVHWLGLLHDSYFDLAQIRYSRKRLVIPIQKRLTYEWYPHGSEYIGYVDGELILYPVLHACDWQITLSGEWINKPERLSGIDVIGAKLTRKVDKESDLPLEYPPEVWYHFRLELYNRMLPCYMDVLLRGWKDFPLICYRDTSMPYDYETRKPLPLSGGRP